MLRQLTKIEDAFFHQVLASYLGNITGNHQNKIDWMQDKQYVISQIWSAYGDNQDKVAMIKELRTCASINIRMLVSLHNLSHCTQNSNLLNAVNDNTSLGEDPDVREFCYYGRVLGLKEAKDFCDFMWKHTSC